MEIPALDQTNGTKVSPPPNHLGDHQQVPVDNPEGTRFCRLRKP